MTEKTQRPGVPGRDKYPLARPNRPNRPGAADAIDAVHEAIRDQCLAADDDPVLCYAAVTAAYPVIAAAVLADAAAELEQSGQLAASLFVARLAENTQR